MHARIAELSCGELHDKLNQYEIDLDHLMVGVDPFELLDHLTNVRQSTEARFRKGQSCTRLLTLILGIEMLKREQFTRSAICSEKCGFCTKQFT